MCVAISLFNFALHMDSGYSGCKEEIRYLRKRNQFFTGLLRRFELQNGR